MRLRVTGMEGEFVDTIIEQIVDFADLPASVVRACKRRLIDTVGCALVALDSEPAGIARKLALRVGMEGGARVLGTRHRASPEGRGGEALGLRVALDYGIRAIGPVIFGAIASSIGVSAIFWISALLLGAGGVVSHRDAQKGGRGT